MPRLHERHFIVEQAHIDLATAVVEIAKKHSLTHSELANILIRELAQWNKYAIRDERSEPSSSPDQPEH